MTDASTELTQLWELLGKGTHEAWPECVKYDDEWGMGWVFVTQRDMVRISPHHALAIVRYSVEGWLRSKQWAKHDNPRNGLLYYSVGPDAVPDADTLPDAVRYALESTPA